MTGIRRALAALAASAAAWATAAHAQVASFDCRQAQTETEWAICNTPELGALDVEMAATYRLLSDLAPDSSRLARQAGQSQAAWIRGKRNACGGDVGCLSREYRQHISQLRELARKSFVLRP